MSSSRGKWGGDKPREEAPPPKKAWADEGDDDEEGDAADQPMVFTTQPDEHGIKQVITHRTNEKGQRVKIVRKVKVTKKVVQINRNVAKRRRWAKFGICADAPPGPESSTTIVSSESIPLVLKPRKREEEESAETKDPLRQLQGSVIKCRFCQEEGKHYSLQCPKRNEIQVAGVTENRDRLVPNKSGLPSTGGNKYVPVHLRSGGGGRGGGRGGGTQMGRDDSATIRVTNISEDTNEDDLRELFRPYGRTTRIYLAKDRQSGQSRGFAFISYTNRDEAQRAIDALNDRGYDSLILHVEFAQPREERDDKTGGPGGGGGGGPSFPGAGRGAPGPPPGSTGATGAPGARNPVSSLAYSTPTPRQKFDQYDSRAF